MNALHPGLAVFFKHDSVLLDIHDSHAMDYVSFVDELIIDYWALSVHVLLMFLLFMGKLEMAATCAKIHFHHRFALTHSEHS